MSLTEFLKFYWKLISYKFFSGRKTLTSLIQKILLKEWMAASNKNILPTEEVGFHLFQLFLDQRSK